MESRLENSFTKGHSWKVSQSNNEVYEIKGFPCARVVVGIQKNDRDLNELVEPYFHVSEYRSTYGPTIYPILIVENHPLIQGIT
ncbi:hypothetical protein ACSBR1_014957 [Camellia fascicularis]